MLWEGIKLVDKTLKYFFVLLMGVVLESDSAGFNMQQQVLTWTAALCSHTIRMVRWLL